MLEKFDVGDTEDARFFLVLRSVNLGEKFDVVLGIYVARDGLQRHHARLLDGCGERSAQAVSISGNRVDAIVRGKAINLQNIESLRQGLAFGGRGRALALQSTGRNFSRFFDPIQLVSHVVDTLRFAVAEASSRLATPSFTNSLNAWSDRAVEALCI